MYQTSTQYTNIYDRLPEKTMSIELATCKNNTKKLKKNKNAHNTKLQTK